MSKTRDDKQDSSTQSSKRTKFYDLTFDYISLQQEAVFMYKSKKKIIKMQAF